MDIERLRTTLKQLASRECWSDDPEFIPDDYAGGNIDDAYSGGREDGASMFARQLLQQFFNEDE